MKVIEALRAFFEANGGRKLTHKELKELGTDGRLELARMCAAILGVTLVGAQIH